MLCDDIAWTCTRPQIRTYSSLIMFGQDCAMITGHSLYAHTWIHTAESISPYSTLLNLDTD
jgi:hypothetical protein